MNFSAYFTTDSLLGEDLRQMERGSERAGADTIKLWGYYREHAYLWRALALIQMPCTLLALFAALIMFLFADTRIETQPHSLPSLINLGDIPDRELVTKAGELVNLINTYQPDNAQDRFMEARTKLWEPALSIFDKSIMQEDLPLIIQTRRTQVFFPDKQLIKVDRYPENDLVVVRVPGMRLKVIGEQPQSTDQVAYFVKFSTIPRNVLNESGLVAVDVRSELISRTDLMNIDRKERKQKRARELAEKTKR